MLPVDSLQQQQRAFVAGKDGTSLKSPWMRRMWTWTQQHQRFSKPLRLKHKETLKNCFVKWTDCSSICRHWRIAWFLVCYTVMSSKTDNLHEMNGRKIKNRFFSNFFYVPRTITTFVTTLLRTTVKPAPNGQLLCRPSGIGLCWFTIDSLHIASCLAILSALILSKLALLLLRTMYFLHYYLHITR